MKNKIILLIELVIISELWSEILTSELNLLQE